MNDLMLGKNIKFFNIRYFFYIEEKCIRNELYG